MIQVRAPDGSVIQFPEGTPDNVIEQAMRAEFGGPTAPEDVRDSTGVPGGPDVTAPRTQQTQSGLDYADDTAAILFQGARGGAADLLGLPVDAVNAGMRFAGLPSSDRPFLGSEMIEDVIGMPSRVAASALDRPYELEPQDATQRVAGRVGREIGATAVPLAGTLGVASRVGVEGARQMGPIGRMFVEPAAVAPATLAGKEAMFAVGAGTGAGIANEVAGNPQEGDNFWSDFLGSLGGVGVTATADRLVGAGRNAAAATLGKPQWMDDVAGEAVADQLINNSSMMAEQAASRGGAVDTGPLARQLRTPAPIEDAVPGYRANIGDRSNDPGLMTWTYNQDARSPGAANRRRAGNEATVTQRINDLSPGGDEAQFRAALEANRDAQIAEVLDAEMAAREIFGQAEQAAQPTMRDAAARGSSLRSGLQDRADAANANVDQLYDPLNNSTAEVPINPLVERFRATRENLPVNDQDRFLPTEAGLPDRLAADGRETVPLREVTAARSGLSQDLRTQRRAGERQGARVTGQFQKEVDSFLDETLPPDLNEMYDTARRARADYGDRFEAPGSAVAESLRRNERGDYALDDSAVANRFTPTDQGRVSDMQALLREAGDDPRVRTALADEVLSDVQSRGLLGKPEQLQRYMGERNILLGEFPELRQNLTRARAAGEYQTGVAKASQATQDRLTRPGASAQASYLRYDNEATVDAVRNLTSGPKPREATRELLEAAGNSPEARQNARSAFWRMVETKKLPAAGATGETRWDGKKLRAVFDDPKTAAVAEELWADAPEDLANIREVFGALATAEGSTRSRAVNSSGTAQAVTGGWEPSLTAASVASRARSVSRGVLSAPIAVLDATATWLRGRSKQVQARAIDELASTVANTPGFAADLLDAHNPADWAAKRRMLTQKYGVRATQAINILDEVNEEEDETMEAIGGR